MDVADWLRALGLEQYEAAFRENGVRAEVLCHLTADDLKELGITAVGHRRELLVAIAKLRDDDAASLLAARPNNNHRASTAAAERRQITVLFCDMVGSTPLSTGLDPEELREILTTYQTNVAAAVTGERGYIARFVGDGVLAYFGWPNADEAHAESAVRAGLAIVEAVGPQQLSVRIGIATGLVVTGDLIGVGAAQTMTAVGETPNLAARLQSLAQPNTIVVSDATRSQLGQMFELEGLGLHALKGFDTPVRPWRVLGKTAAASRSEVVYVSALTPLVGRDEELGQLLRLWSHAKTGEGRVILLSGEAGIGKSRLLAALQERLAGEPHVSLHYFCSPYHQDSPLYPLIARLEREAGFTRGDSAGDRLTKLEAILALTAPPPEEIALLAELLSIPTAGRYPVLELSPQQQKTRTFAALLDRLSALARKDPVLMLFEDAHWSDHSSIELLQAIVEQVPNRPVLMVVSFRPDFVAPWFGQPRVSLMALSRLDRRDATVLATHVVKNHHRLSSPLLDRIAMQSDGVPLFIEELSKAVLEAPDLSAEDITLPVPNTLQASLMARLDRLPTAKMVAQIGSVIGREFPHTLLTVAAGLPDAQLMEGLSELAAAGLLFRRGAPPDAVYMFKHALVRDVAYASLLKAPRQQLHRRLGEALRDVLPEQAETQPEVVAYHFAQSGLSEGAIQWWSKAGDRALRRSAHTEAVGHLEKALEMSRTLGDAPEQRHSRLRLEIIYANALRTARGYAHPETTAAFARAREIAVTLGDVPERFSALNGLWVDSQFLGELTAMRELAEEMWHIVDGRPELPETGVAYRLRGMTSWFAGDFIDARQHLEHAIRCYDSDRDGPLRYRVGSEHIIASMRYLAFTLFPLDVGNGAHCFIEEAISHAVSMRYFPSIANAYMFASMIEMMRRDSMRCAPHVKAFVDLALEHRMPSWRGNGLFIEGWLLCRAGDHDGGAARMQEGLRIRREQRQSLFRPLFGVLLAETEAAAGHDDTALVTIDTELAAMYQTGQCWFLAEAHRMRGEILLKSNPDDTEAAEAAFTEAIEVARGQSAKRYEFHAAMRLAQLWTGQGRGAEHSGLLVILADGLPDGSDFSGFPEMQ
jgi:class 3 adenylate cyclase